MTDTIFALATPPGRGAVAVMRVSGPAARRTLIALARRPSKPRYASLRTLRNKEHEVLDRALVLWFPGPASFTGDDCVELHLHGGRAVIDSVTRALLESGARLARPGEFTRRAFENGKLDLAQAEGIADLIDAETASQSRQALDQLAGALGVRYAGWRETLVVAMSRLEASVDFPEEDTASQIAISVEPGLRVLSEELRQAVKVAQRGRLVRDGFRIALVGAPNAGKSSLLNAIAQRDAVIVNAQPGTTRDVIEVALDFAGYRVLVSDTAGFRATADEVEIEGVNRAGAVARAAALRLWVVDASDGAGLWREGLAFVQAGDLCLLNKSDLPDGEDSFKALAFAEKLGCRVIRVRARDGDVAELSAAIETTVVAALSGSEFPAATRVRHLQRLSECLSSVERCLSRLGEPELAAEDLRIAARAVERVTGVIDVEDVLDRVFSSFCIGK